MLQEAEISPKNRVLDVTGYSLAVLARLANFVVGLETDGELVVNATAVLADLGTANDAVKAGPLARGSPEVSPYDVLVIEGAVETVPATLTDQLTPTV